MFIAFRMTQSTRFIEVEQFAGMKAKKKNRFCDGQNGRKEREKKNENPTQTVEGGNGRVVMKTISWNILSGLHFDWANAKNQRRSRQARTFCLGYVLRAAATVVVAMAVDSTLRAPSNATAAAATAPPTITHHFMNETNKRAHHRHNTRINYSPMLKKKNHTQSIPLQA